MEKWITEESWTRSPEIVASQSPFVHGRPPPGRGKAGIPSILRSELIAQFPGGIERAERLVSEAVAAGFSGYHFTKLPDYMYVNAQGRP